MSRTHEGAMHPLDPATSRGDIEDARDAHGHRTTDRQRGSYVAEAPSSRRERDVLLAVFTLALVLRLVYVVQLSSAPFFDHPLGDSQLYLARARDIAAGDWLGKDVFFHSSPPYPYFLAGLIAFGRGSIWPVYLAQALIGAANCVVIALLARRVSRGRSMSSAVMTVAGFIAAAYGVFAFFDGDLLMIALTIFCVDVALLLLLRAHDEQSAKWSGIAGFAFALGALDKVNLLVCAPVALWFLGNGLRWRGASWNLARPSAFLAALALMIAPVTIRNWVVGHDLVLVSSNGGVNFFIGNNPDADGSFFAPQASGLQDPFLYESSLSVASKALGHAAKPSEASSYWAARAWSYITEHPLDELALLARKAKLLVNAYEIPGHMNFAYVRIQHAPVLRWMFVGFGAVLALALAGLGADRAGPGEIGSRARASRDPASRLLVAFAVVYAGTIVAFFVTERYRLPIVPVLIVFASTSIVDAWNMVRARRWSALVWWSGALLAGLALAHLPEEPFRFALNRAGDAQSALEKARAEPKERAALLAQSIRDFRWVLEEEPQFTAARLGLAVALADAGYLDESARELERIVDAAPDFAYATNELRQVREKQRLGALPPESPMPRTPFEDAHAAIDAGRIDDARRLLEDLLRRDPFHAPARAELEKLTR